MPKSGRPDHEYYKMCVLWGLAGHSVHLQNCIQLRTSLLECANFIYVFLSWDNFMFFLSPSASFITVKRLVYVKRVAQNILLMTSGCFMSSHFGVH
jgi:hypothetical protein